MTASLLKFPIPSRGRYSCRELAAYEPATVAGGRMVCFTPQQGQNNPARISLIARHPRSIVVRGQNDNRFTVSHPPFVASRRELAGEDCADFCCNLHRLFISPRGGRADLNFCRSFRRAAGNPFLRALQSLQKSKRCVFQTLKSFRGFVRHVDEHDERNIGNVRKSFGEIRNA